MSETYDNLSQMVLNLHCRPALSNSKFYDEGNVPHLS